jgi:uncharacterized protein RhaS with RHS repeats
MNSHKSRLDTIFFYSSYEYDDHNNLIKAFDPYQKYISTEYNTDNLPVKIIDQKGQYSNIENVNEGRVHKNIDGAGNEIIYTYDESSATTVSSYQPVKNGFPTFSRSFYYDTEGTLGTF